MGQGRCGEMQILLMTRLFPVAVQLFYVKKSGAESVELSNCHNNLLRNLLG